MAIHIIPERDSMGKTVNSTSPFKSKATGEGSLFRRKHGFKGAEILDGEEGSIELVVPYNLCHINEMEFTNCREGITVDFKVHDTPTGTLSTIPNYMLNQFGFDVELPDHYYRDHSDYDATLILNMKIVILVKNNTGAAITPKGNIVYHEVK